MDGRRRKGGKSSLSWYQSSTPFTPSRSPLLCVPLICLHITSAFSLGLRGSQKVTHTLPAVCTGLTCVFISTWQFRMVMLERSAVCEETVLELITAQQLQTDKKSAARCKHCKQLKHSRHRKQVKHQKHCKHHKHSKNCNNRNHSKHCKPCKYYQQRKHSKHRIHLKHCNQSKHCKHSN